MPITSVREFLNSASSSYISEDEDATDPLQSVSSRFANVDDIKYQNKQWLLRKQDNILDSEYCYRAVDVHIPVDDTRGI